MAECSTCLVLPHARVFGVKGDRLPRYACGTRLTLLFPVSAHAKMHRLWILCTCIQELEETLRRLV